MASLHDKGDELLRFVVDRNHVHLGAWNHDVAHRHFGNLQRPFDDRQRVGVEQFVLERAVQQREQFLAVFRLADQERRKPLEQRGSLRVFAGRVSAHREARREGLVHGPGPIRYGLPKPRRARMAVSRASICTALSARSWSCPCRCSMPWTTRCAQCAASDLPCFVASRRSTGAQRMISPLSIGPSAPPTSSYTNASTLVGRSRSRNCRLRARLSVASTKRSTTDSAVTSA